MNLPYDSALIGQFFKAKSFERGLTVNKSMIHKMLYLLYGFYLAEHNQLIVNEQPRAWPSGPAFPNVEIALTQAPFQSVNDPKFKELKNDVELVTYVSDILKLFVRHSDDDVAYWLRTDRTPYRKVISKPDFMWNDTISDADIKSYFGIF